MYYSFNLKSLDVFLKSITATIVDNISANGITKKIENIGVIPISIFEKTIGNTIINGITENTCLISPNKLLELLYL